jgi:uncharacterized protein (TIGR03083 family)
MTMATIDITTIPPLTHLDAMRLQERELALTVAFLQSLEDDEWQAATDCPAWDIRAMYQHVLGACEAGASMRENVHQMLRARSYRKRNGGPLEVALSSVQVSERANLGPTQIVQRLAAISPRTVRGRSRTPAPLRHHASLAVDGPVVERWKLGYLIDTIYLRDLWMHRIDAFHALGRRMSLTAAHDGRIVADVVVEWAGRHGKPFTLDLTGPAGGRYERNPDLPEADFLSLDAVQFCRTLAGRAEAHGLLTTVVPF